MIAELSQNRLLNKRKIIVLDTKVVYQSSQLGKGNDISIPYEELTAIKEDYTIYFKHIGLYTGILLFFAIISFISRDDKDYDPNMWLLFTFLLIVACTFYLLIRENVWKIRLANYTYIFINKKLPNKNVVDSFIEKLFEQRKKYLKETYFFISKNMAYEPQFKNLQWLKKIEVINSEEFDKMRQELDALFSNEKKSIGY